MAHRTLFSVEFGCFALEAIENSAHFAVKSAYLRAQTALALFERLLVPLFVDPLHHMIPIAFIPSLVQGG